MKLGIRILLLFVLFHLTKVTIANNNFLNDNFSNSSIDNEWILVKSEQGIKVYFSQYNHIDGTLNLKIKFENLTNEDINFSWTLTNKTKTTKLNDISKVDANMTVEIMNEDAPISIYAGEAMNDFQIKINLL